MKFKHVLIGAGVIALAVGGYYITKKFMEDKKTTKTSTGNTKTTYHDNKSEQTNDIPTDTVDDKVEIPVEDYVVEEDDDSVTIAVNLTHPDKKREDIRANMLENMKDSLATFLSSKLAKTIDWKRIFKKVKDDVLNDILTE